MTNPPRIDGLSEAIDNVENREANFCDYHVIKVIQAARAWLEVQEGAETPGWLPTHLHTKRGTEYRVLNTAIMQCFDGAYDDMPLVLYVDKDGNHWVRPTEKFNDGRFV